MTNFKHFSEAVKKRSSKTIHCIQSSQARQNSNVVFLIFTLETTLDALLYEQMLLLDLLSWEVLPLDKFAAIRSIKVLFFIHCPIFASNYNFLFIRKKNNKIIIIINLALLESHGQMEYWNGKYFLKKKNKIWKNEYEIFFLLLKIVTDWTTWPQTFQTFPLEFAVWRKWRLKLISTNRQTSYVLILEKISGFWLLFL